jgi:hypothetical protein
VSEEEPFSEEMIVQSNQPGQTQALGSTDSIGVEARAETGQTTDLFAGHVLQPENNSAQPLLERTPDWFTIILFLSLAGVAYVRALYPKIFNQLLKSVFSDTLTSQTVREENTLVQRASVFLSFIFYVVSALFLYQVSVYFGWTVKWISSGILRFIFFGLLIAFSYSVKLLVIKSVGWLFGADKPFSYYIFNTLLINNLLGIALIPIVLAIAFVDIEYVASTLWLGIGFVLISFFYRLIRGVFIWKGVNSIPFFYLILYFCTLEIAPLLVIIKLAAISY